jgi:hypothetical protein
MKDLINLALDSHDVIKDYITTNEKKKTRKQRSDRNKPRKKYDKSLPKEYKSYLSRANNKGLTFDISVEDFYTIVNQDCFYCGSEGTNGLDRIDCKGDYTKDNVVPCCTKCNTMKFIYSPSEFIKHVKKIYNYQQLYI